MHRRSFLQTAVAGNLALAGMDSLAPGQEKKKVFRVWVMGCSHVGTDLKRGKRESLASAIRQSEGQAKEDAPPFAWDIALHLGDLSGNQGSPADEEGRLVVKQFNATRKHCRECFYNIAGNHDASLPGEASMAWYKKWVDPLGKNSKFSGVDPKSRPYPIEGTWERYHFQVGNLLFLMMSDRNDGGPPVGRGKRGGYPAGAVTGATFDWWKDMVKSNRESVIVTAHHHVLKATTVASGEFEGFQKLKDGGYRSWYHGYYPRGGPKGASYLYFVDGKPDAQGFERYLAEHTNAVDFWLGGHTHARPDDKRGGRSHVERKWDVNFVNCSALTLHHGRKEHQCPMSRLLTFTEGSKKVRVQCYLHTGHHAKKGWYARDDRMVDISKPFRMRG